MIKTKFDVAIEINEKSFHISICEPTKSQQKELKETLKESSEEQEAIAQMKLDLNACEKEFKINEDLLSADVDKELLLEQKALLKSITESKKQILTLEKKATNFADVIEAIYEKRYELLVSGTDKVALQKEIEECGVSYSVLFTNINKLIAKEQEKK